MKQTIRNEKSFQDQMVADFFKDKLRIKRNSGTGCSSGQVDNSIGNLGFNSFNFLTFMILTFNAVTNVNNNINNNNNNNNDVSLNSISQSSTNTVSNSDNSNDIMVMILPMPGGRKKRFLDQNNTKSLKNNTKSLILKEIWSSILEFVYQSKFVDSNCEPYVICKILKNFRRTVKLHEVLFIKLLESKDHPPLLSILSCNKLFPHCSI